LETTHTVHFSNSREMVELEDRSVNLIVTSPPYPMIEMWDELFFSMNGAIRDKFTQGDFPGAFGMMHDELHRTWNECGRVLADGGIMCVNIGDAVRTLDSEFRLWSNHTVITRYLTDELHLNPLPVILWRKSTNKPNKFMGSGMLAPNAYVTLEHEYILVFRKGGKREFGADTLNRYESAYFWEERNRWFSDVWLDIIGTRQRLGSANPELRERSGAYPLDLVLRLVNMFSVRGDTVLDPFWGTGTTSVASMLLGRNSQGYELSREFYDVFREYASNVKEYSVALNTERIQDHFEFISSRQDPPKHRNDTLGMGVITQQETRIQLYDIASVAQEGEWSMRVTYVPHRMSMPGVQCDLFGIEQQG
jgi:modification methylase